jgi:hypothetical protein
LGLGEGLTRLDLPLNRPRWLLLTIAGGALALLLIACGGDGKGAATPTNSPIQSATTLAAPTLGASDLGRLLLLDAAVTVGDVSLPYDANQSKPMTRDYIAAQGFDSDWQLAEMDKFHWIAEEYQDFGNGNQASPVFDGSVDLALYASAEDAKGAMSDRFDRLLLTWPGKVFGETTIDSTDEWAVTGIEGARGFKATVTVTSDTSGKRTTYYMTNLDFVRGLIIVDIGTASLDQRDLRDAAIQLAQSEDSHLRLALTAA